MHVCVRFWVSIPTYLLIYRVHCLASKNLGTLTFKPYSRRKERKVGKKERRGREGFFRRGAAGDPILSIYLYPSCISGQTQPNPGEGGGAERRVEEIKENGSSPKAKRSLGRVSSPPTSRSGPVPLPRSLPVYLSVRSVGRSGSYV